MPVPMGQICQRGLCNNNASVEIKKKDSTNYICNECHMKDKSNQINKIIIDPHHCSRDEFGELITYLEDNCWDYKIQKPNGEKNATKNP